MTPYPLTAYVINQPGIPFSESLSVVFDTVSLTSFLTLWLATLKSLSQYQYKMGTVKFFILMGIPPIYYIFPLQVFWRFLLLSVGFWSKRGQMEAFGFTIVLIQFLHNSINQIINHNRFFDKASQTNRWMNLS
jgi:hypothetical protein